MKEKATMLDIAKMTNVSQATVSRVINGNPDVNPLITQRVLDAAKKLKYDVNSSSSKNGLRKSQIIGLLLPDIMNPIFPLMIKGIELGAQRFGYNLLLGDSNNNSKTEFKRLQDLLSQRIRGLIWIASESPNKSLDFISKYDIPTVFLDRFVDKPDINYVGAQNIEGSYQAAKYIISLGHEKILYISGPKTIHSSIDRLQGYLQAREDNNLKPDKSLIRDGDFTIQTGYVIVRKALEENEKFTCIFAANDLMAYGALKALREANLSVPDDMSIIGYDDIPYSEMVGLTTVSQPSFDLGYNTFTLLQDIIEYRVTSPQILLSRPILTIRDSCKKI